MERNNFMSLYAQVCSRNFGWGLPNTAMIPMADNFNHADVNILCEIISKPLHLSSDEHSRYFTKNKFMYDVSCIYTAEEIK